MILAIPIPMFAQDTQDTQNQELDVAMGLERINDSTIKLIAESNSDYNIQYQFDVRIMDKETNYTTIREYSTEDVFLWNDANPDTIYEIVAHAITPGNQYKGYYMVFANTNPNNISELQNVKIEVSNTNKDIYINAYPEGGTNLIYAAQYRRFGDTKYSFLYFDKWYQSIPNFSKTLDYGKYEFVVHVIDVTNGKMVYHADYTIFEHYDPNAKPKVIHSTDLFYPHEDFDDILDLMTMFGLHKMGEIELAGVLLDDPVKQIHRPGSTYISQLNSITGLNVRNTPHSNTLLQWLEESNQPVTITVVGSMTNLWQAYQTNPELCNQKIKEVWVFCGEAQENPIRTHPRGREWYHRGLEYNVSLDVPAFKGIMDSDLDIVWIPCYDGGHFDPRINPAIGHNMVNGSYHRNTYGSILGNSSQEAKNFVVNGLKSCIHYPRPSINWSQVALLDKSLFGVGIFRAIGNENLQYPFTFDKINIVVNENGTIGKRSEGKEIRLFRRTSSDFYNDMSRVTAEILKNI